MHIFLCIFTQHTDTRPVSLVPTAAPSSQKESGTKTPVSQYHVQESSTLLTGANTLGKMIIKMSIIDTYCLFSFHFGILMSYAAVLKHIKFTLVSHMLVIKPKVINTHQKAGESRSPAPSISRR